MSEASIEGLEEKRKSHRSIASLARDGILLTVASLWFALQPAKEKPMSETQAGIPLMHHLSLPVMHSQRTLPHIEDMVEEPPTLQEQILDTLPTHALADSLYARIEDIASFVAGLCYSSETTLKEHYQVVGEIRDCMIAKLGKEQLERGELVEICYPEEWSINPAMYFLYRMVEVKQVKRDRRLGKQPLAMPYLSSVYGEIRTDKRGKKRRHLALDLVATAGSEVRWSLPETEVIDKGEKEKGGEDDIGNYVDMAFGKYIFRVGHTAWERAERGSLQQGDFVAVMGKSGSLKDRRPYTRVVHIKVFKKGSEGEIAVHPLMALEDFLIAHDYEPVRALLNNPIPD